MRWACLVAALGAAAYLLLEPASADLAAQQYRAGLGIGLWDNGWFAGHHTPGYSVVAPPLGALIGVRAAGAAASIAASALFAAIAQRRWGSSAGSAAGMWFAVGATGMLVSGRVTFLVGVAIALAAALALQRGRRGLAVGLALLTSLASPVAGLFLALAALAWALAGGREQRAWGAGVTAAALAPLAALGVLFAEGGSEPFVASAFWPSLAAIVLVAAILPTRERALRIGAGIYALGTIATFAIATPLGGNVTRLGALLAGPVVLGALLAERTRRGAAPGAVRAVAARPVAMAVIALSLLYWQAYPAVRDVVRSSGDPSTAAAYHAPLVRYLEHRPGSFRVEVPMTANHWEARYVAARIPLARGWERQLDRRYGALFYDGTLTQASYRAWLDEQAVAYVALPDVALDDAARAEARLIARGTPYLHEVWHNQHWRVFAVRRPAPLVSGAATEIDVSTDGFAIRARRTGDALVRIRHTRWWAVTAGHACVHPGPDGMTRVTVMSPGTVRVQARLLGSSCRR